MTSQVIIMKKSVHLPEKLKVVLIWFFLCFSDYIYLCLIWSLLHWMRCDGSL